VNVRWIMAQESVRCTIVKRTVLCCNQHFSPNVLHQKNSGDGIPTEGKWYVYGIGKCAFYIQSQLRTSLPLTLSCHLTLFGHYMPPHERGRGSNSSSVRSASPYQRTFTRSSSIQPTDDHLVTNSLTGSQNTT
jgi:hypothetical protein